MPITKRKYTWINNHDLTLFEKIIKYRAIKTKTFIIMAIIIISLLGINYYNIAYFNSTKCDHTSKLQITQIQKDEIVSENDIINRKPSGVIILSNERTKAGYENSKNSFDKYMKNISAFQFHDTFNQVGHLQNKRGLMQPRILVSKHRNNASIVIGIPTVKRKSNSYIILMMTSLFDALNNEENKKNSVLVVVSISEVFIF